MLCPDCFAQQIQTAERSQTFFFTIGLNHCIEQSTQTIGLNHCIEQSTQKPSYYKLFLS